MSSTLRNHSFHSRVAGAACVAVTGAVIAFLLASRTSDYGTLYVPATSSTFVIVNTREMAREEELPAAVADAERPVPDASESLPNFGIPGSGENPGDGFSDWSAGPARPDGDAFSMLSLRRAAATLIPSATPASRQKVVLPAHRPASWPAAPSPAELTGIGGVTTMIVCISPEGGVTEVRVAGKSGSTVLDNKAREWLLQQQFEPGTLDGARVDFCGWNDFAWKKLAD